MVMSGWPPQSPRNDWLGLDTEPAIEPGLPIVDPHSHLWDSDDASRYLLTELQADLRSGPNVLGTVFVECNFRYRTDGPERFRPVGETAAVAAIAEQAAPGDPQIYGIVGSANLELGAAVGDVLDAHIEVGRGRFRGVRLRATHDPDPAFRSAASPDLLHDPTLRRGIHELVSRGLVLDLWLYHPQIRHATELARAIPECTIVLGHTGGILGVGPYADRRSEILESWNRDIAELAQCPNVVMKVGGLGQLFYGYEFHERETPPSSDDLAEAWREPVLRSIEAFGTDRCIFETNWPPDRASANYRTIWNALKKLTAELAPSERAELFRDAAARTYSLSY